MQSTKTYSRKLFNGDIMAIEFICVKCGRHTGTDDNFTTEYICENCKSSKKESFKLSDTVLTIIFTSIFWITLIFLYK